MTNPVAPISAAERDALIPIDVTTRAQLDALEKTTLLKARRWALGHRRGTTQVLTETFLRELHRRMFGTTWRWAGEYRTTDTPDLLAAIGTILADTTRDLADPHLPPRIVAARFHHRLVVLQPFPHGNGRWSRLATDALLLALHEPMPSWGMTDGNTAPRRNYLDALKHADAGEFDPLCGFMWT